MLVYFPRKVKKWQNCTYFLTMTYFSFICIMFGLWSGSPIDSVHSFEPQMCSVKQPNGTWSFDLELDSALYVNCNESLRNVDTSNLSEYFVEFIYPFSLDNLTMLSSDWIEQLNAFMVFRQGYEVPLDDPTLDFEAEIMFLNETSHENKWKSLALSKGKRHIDCSFLAGKRYIYGCRIIPIFELSSVDYFKYRLTIRFRGRSSQNITYISEMEHLSDMSLMLRHVHPGFSEAMADLKTCCLPIMLLAHIIYIWSHRPLITLMECVLCLHSIVAVIANVPFGYLWKFTHYPIWTHFTRLADVTFQTSLFMVWLFFIRFLCCDGRLPLKLANYHHYILGLFVWHSWTSCDEYIRWSVLEDPFFYPWDHHITAFKAITVYDSLRELIALFFGLFVLYHLYTTFRNVCKKRRLLMLHFASDRWFEVDTSTSQNFALCLADCVCLAAHQFNLDVIRQLRWKAGFDDVFVNCFLHPLQFTLFLGHANFITLMLLWLMPKLNVHANDNKLGVRVFKDQDDFKDHAIYCCLHSPERLFLCRRLPQRDGTATTTLQHGSCCMHPQQIIKNRRIMITKAEENCTVGKDVIINEIQNSGKCQNENGVENEELLDIKMTV